MQISGSAWRNAAMAAVIAAGVAGAAAAQTDPRAVPLSQAQVQLSFAPVASRASPAVVNVYADRTIANPAYANPFYRQFGVPLRPRLDWSHPAVRQIARRLWPAVFSSMSCIFSGSPRLSKNALASSRGHSWRS